MSCIDRPVLFSSSHDSLLVDLIDTSVFLFLARRSVRRSVLVDLLKNLSGLGPDEANIVSALSEFVQQGQTPPWYFLCIQVVFLCLQELGGRPCPDVLDKTMSRRWGCSMSQIPAAWNQPPWWVEDLHHTMGPCALQHPRNSFCKLPLGSQGVISCFNIYKYDRTTRIVCIYHTTPCTNWSRFEAFLPQTSWRCSCT